MSKKKTVSKIASSCNTDCSLPLFFIGLAPGAGISPTESLLWLQLMLSEVMLRNTSLKKEKAAKIQKRETFHLAFSLNTTIARNFPFLGEENISGRECR